MATVKELKATARPKAGKGAARAERRAGRIPAVIYGNNQPPLTISLDDAELRLRIQAGRFLTTIHDIELDGKKHRVIPRDLTNQLGFLRPAVFSRIVSLRVRENNEHANSGGLGPPPRQTSASS